MEARGPATIDSSVSYDIVSRATGTEYRIDLALPVGVTDPGRPVPAIYLLDANRAFGLVAGVQRVAQLPGDFPPCMVVGIGYPDSSFPEWIRRRTKDFTPNEDEGDRARAAAAGRETPPDRAGGAEAFLTFLREEVVPLAESHGASPERRTLLGHSLGGLFALYAMFQGSGLFSRFLIGSPQIWWGGAAIRRIEDEFLASKQPLEARVFLGVGGQEEASGAPEMDSARMVSNTFLLASRLMGPAYPGVTAELQLFPGEGHGSMMAPFITRGLRALFVQS